jgi:hypothetical protein
MANSNKFELNDQYGSLLSFVLKREEKWEERPNSGVMDLIGGGNLNFHFHPNFQRSNNPFTFLLTKHKIDKSDGSIWNWI